MRDSAAAAAAGHARDLRRGMPDGSTPLADIPAVNDTEPRLRIPIPQGWERNSTMDSQTTWSG